MSSFLGGGSGGGTGSPGGNPTTIQFNNSGVFGGVAGATSDGTSITFASSDLKMAGSSTGVTTFASGNAGASNFTITFPAATGTVALTSGIPVGANPSATASDVAVNGSASTFMRSDGAPAVQLTSSTLFGLCKVDNVTITAAAGVISSTGGSSAGGIDTNIQFNDGGTAFGGATNFNYIKATGRVNLTTTTDSSSTTTGALVVSGGVGIAKNLFVGSNINLATSTAAGNGEYVFSTTFSLRSIGTTSNIFLGSGGNYSGITGTDNVAIGGSVLGALTSGTINVCIGNSTGTKLQNGGSNIFLGFAAGYACSSGSNNIALGVQALGDFSAANTASGNVCIGEFSGAIITSGATNLCFGPFAGAGITSGASNVAIGSQAIGQNAVCTGSTNIAINALNALTSGHDNIAISGLGALLTGVSNVCIGSGTGSNYTGSESRNLILGPLTGTAGESDTIQFGTSSGTIRLDYEHTTSGHWTMAGILTIPALSTAGVLVNDGSGNVSSDSNANAATVSASFIADHRLTITIGATTYYIAMSTTAW